MKVITLKDMLQNEKIELISIEKAMQLKSIIEEDMKDDYILRCHNKFLPRLKPIIKDERNLLNIKSKYYDKVADDLGLDKKQRMYNFNTTDFTFWFNEQALYVQLDGVNMLEVTGKLHDLLKYEDCLQSSAKDSFFMKNTPYEFYKLSYSTLINQYVLQWGDISYKSFDFYDENNKVDIHKFSESYKQFLNEYFNEELEETIGIIDENGVNSIGVKYSAYFDTEFKYYNKAENFIEIMRIEDTEQVLGRNGILQLFICPEGQIEEFDECSWLEEGFYYWHFTPAERVESMKLIQSVKNIADYVKKKVSSDKVLNFTITTQPLTMDTIYDKINELEYAKAMALYITGDDNTAIVYENEYGNYNPLNKSHYENIYNLIEYASDVEDNRHKVALHFTNSFSTQGYNYKLKENERFLLSVQSENLSVRDDNVYQYALNLGDAGSISFAINNKLFKDENIIKVTDFNADCY